MTLAKCLERLDVKARNLLEEAVEISVRITLMLKEDKPIRILKLRGEE